MAINETSDSLQGSVKEFTARTVTLSEKGEELEWVRFVAFDRAGNKIEEKQYQPDGALIIKHVYAYDSGNKLVEQSLYGGGESLYSKTVLQYDSNGRLIERRMFDSAGSVIGTQRPAYTSEGLRIEEETLLPVEDSNVGCLIDIEGTDMLFPSDGIRKFRKTYDLAGRLLEISSFDDKGVRVGKILLAYDDGKLIEVEQYGGGNGFEPCGERTKWQRAIEPLVLRLFKAFLFLKCLYSFGARGKLKRLWRCFAYGLLMAANVFVYDEQGRIVEEQTFFAGWLMIKKVFVYGDKGNKTEETEHIKDERLAQKQIYERECDAHGNWIKEIVTHQFSPNDQLQEMKTATYRDINYYSN